MSMPVADISYLYDPAVSFRVTFYPKLNQPHIGGPKLMNAIVRPFILEQGVTFSTWLVCDLVASQTDQP